MENFFGQMLAYILNVVIIVMGIGVLIVILIIVTGKKISKKDRDLNNH